MLAEERRLEVLRRLSRDGSVEIAGLVDEFGVSEMTVRRDLATLQDEGLLRRVRGGAMRPHERSQEAPFALRRSDQEWGKQAIASAAAGLVVDGESLAIDVGTTTLALAEQLVERSNLTIVTPSLHVANLLGARPALRVIVTGGVIRASEHSLVGHLAERASEELNVDRVFLGVGGVDPRRGLTEFNPDDTAVKRVMLEHADEVVVLADGTKLGRTALAHVAPIERAHRVITDDGAPGDVVQELRAAGVDVLVVPARDRSETSW